VAGAIRRDNADLHRQPRRYLLPVGTEPWLAVQEHEIM